MPKIIGAVIVIIIIVGFLAWTTTVIGTIHNPYSTGNGWLGPGYYNINGQSVYISNQSQLNSMLNRQKSTASTTVQAATTQQQTTAQTTAPSTTTVQQTTAPTTVSTTTTQTTTISSTTTVSPSKPKITGTIKGFNSPGWVAISPNGAYAYVTNGNETISIVNTSTSKITGTITGFGSSLTGVAFYPDGSFAAVVSWSNQSICIVYTKTNSIVDWGFSRALFEPFGIAIAPNGDVGYVVNTNGTVAVLNLEKTGGYAIEEIPFAVSLLDAVAVAPNGAYVYVTDSAANGSIHIINTSNGGHIGTIYLNSTPFGVAFAPSGAYAYVAACGGICIINTSTKTIAGTIKGFYDASGVAFAPNGHYAYVTNYDNGTISIVSTGN